MPHDPPTEISIGGRTITVRIDPSLDAWGEYHGDNSEIVLAARTLDKASTLRETLREMTLKAAFDISGVSRLDLYRENCVIGAIEGIFHPAWDIIRQKLITLQ